MSRFEKYTMVTLKRSELKGADYNPRVISNQAKARLKRGIAENGLVMPIVWNAATGNIVGGHQRLGVLDDLEGGKDYDIQVARIDVDILTERKLNVLLNNDSAMGHFDEGKLLEILGAEPDGVDYEAFGFSANQAEYYTNLMQQQDLENASIAEAMNNAVDFEQDIASADADPALRDERHAKKLERKRAFEEQVSSLLVPQKPDEWKLKTDEEKRAFDQARTGYRQETFEMAYLRVCFTSPASKKAFLDRYNLPMKDVVHESELVEPAAPAEVPAAETVDQDGGGDA